MALEPSTPDATPDGANAPAALRSPGTTPDATRPKSLNAQVAVDVTRLPFDVYQRYRLVADLVERLADGRALSLLDVGGATGVLRSFLQGHRITLVDVQDSVQPGFVYGDGSRLPFVDDAFDLVVTCDTLEHLPVEARDAFLDECARTARSGVIIAGPYRAERVDEAEETLRAFLREKMQIEHRYLEEHRTYGLPVRAEVEARFEARGLRVTSIGHGNLDRWLALLCTSMYMDEDVHLRRIAGDVYAFYNQALYASDVGEPVYRHAVVALAPGMSLPRAEDLFEPGSAPEGSLEPFLHLAAELFAFDRERDVYDAERARLTAVVDGLVADLDGHKARVGTLEQDLDGHRGTLEQREEDLAGHRALIEQLERLSTERLEALTATELDLEGHRRTVEGLRTTSGQTQRHADELERELERVREEARGERERLAREIAELRTIVEDRERSLNEHSALVETLRDDVTTRREYGEELERELREANALASRLNDELGAERAENAALREELASRWRSLKRALRRRAG